EMRVTTTALLSRLKVCGTAHIYRHLKNVMRSLGWNGPKLTRWGKHCQSGYWRYATVGTLQQREEPAGLAPARADQALAVNGSSDGQLAHQLERVTGLGLQKVEQILRLPTDRHDGNLLRSQVTAAGIAINAQLRADEARLQTKRGSDVLERLIKIMDEEKRLQAERAEQAKQTEKQRQVGQADEDLIDIDNKPNESE